jgi:hypothetical protein
MDEINQGIVEILKAGNIQASRNFTKTQKDTIYILVKTTVIAPKSLNFFELLSPIILVCKFYI